ncbi:MAG: anti-sigma factor [Saprospiraceae bacterium]
MDIQKYIASGILEQYVLGNLSPAESSGVEQYALQYPEIKKEIEAIEEAFEKYAQANAVQPSPDLELKILEKIKDKKNAVDKSDKITTDKKGGSIYTLLYRVAVAAFLGLALWAISLNNELKEKENQLTNLQTQYEELNTNCSEQLKEKEQTELLFAFLKDRNTSSVEMKGLPEKDPNNIAVVFQNNNLKKSYLEVINMPTVASDKQFQLWAIVDGTPVDMGVFDVTVTADSAFIEVPFVENAQAFAVTIEKAGGNPTPTLEEMVVIGNVG